MSAKLQFELSTPLGRNTLLFAKLVAQEALSKIADFQIECLSSETNIDLDSLLGKRISLRVGLPRGKNRFFTGYVTRISHIGTQGRFQAYRLHVQPWLWFLTRTQDCRIFQGKTVPDILKEIFADHAIAEFRDALSGRYRTWDYCVQYRESDYDFASRLMAEEGIYYFFEYAQDKNVLVLCDAYSAHTPIDGRAEIDFVEKPLAGAVKAESDHITHWSYERAVQPGKTVLADFDFTKPSVKLEGSASVPREHDEGAHEVFDYPGRFSQSADGKHAAQLRVDALHAQFELAQATSNARRLMVGRLFGLQGHARKDQNREYLITQTRITLQDEGFETQNNFTINDEAAQGSVFVCDFSALNSRQDFRSTYTQAKPFVQGPQTAIVVGPAGDEIYTDQYGRVKVQFHWDRYGKKDEHSSCWIRVSHPWAGKNWGFIAIPRIGQEVIVEFLEGDPDQPIITGRVYNAEQMPPYELPANKTQTGIKTRSSTGGGVGNFNELRFEDKKGSEQLFIHAEKNQDIEVENDETHWVGHDRRKTVDHDENVEVKNNRSEQVGVNETITIGANRAERVGQNEVIHIGNNRSEAVGQNETITIGAHQSITVGQTKTETIALAKALTIGAGYAVSVGGAMNTAVGLAQFEEVGHSKNTSVGKNYAINAGDELSITVGKASLVMKSDGTVLINGSQFTFTASGPVQISGKDIDLN